MDFISQDLLLPLGLFGVFAIAAWWMLERFSNNTASAEDRLAELTDPNVRRRKTEAANKKSEQFTKVLQKTTPTLARALQPKTEAEEGKLKTRLANAGFRSDSALSIFLGMKIVGLAAGFMLSGGSMLIVDGFTQKTLMITVATAGVLFYFPDLVLALIRKKRKEKLFLGLPDALDLMIVCVEAGLGLDQAMRKVNEEMVKTHPVIAEEFGLSNFQIQMGRQRIEVLRELSRRTAVDDIRSLVGILIQADKFGSSVAQALRVQSDSMRVRRRQIAEEKAAKTAVKLIFPLVIFIFPGIFVVLVGPAAITMHKKLAPTMGG